VRGWTEKKNGEKGVEVGGWWLLFSGPVARAGRKKGTGGVSGVRRCVEEKMEHRVGGSTTWTDMAWMHWLWDAPTAADGARLAGTVATGEGGGRERRGCRRLTGGTGRCQLGGSGRGVVGV
jgi:hypothetical protein